MPPPDAVKSGKVAPLTDEDRRTLVRWIDLGCPIDHDFDPKNPTRRGNGWMLDDQRPTLTLTSPRPGVNGKLERILIGMHDYDTGLDMESLRVIADFPLAGAAVNENLAAKFKSVGDGIWEMKMATPATKLDRGKLTVSVKDRQGNETRIERIFSIDESRGK